MTEEPAQGSSDLNSFPCPTQTSLLMWGFPEPQFPTSKIHHLWMTSQEPLNSKTAGSITYGCNQQVFLFLCLYKSIKKKIQRPGVCLSLTYDTVTTEDTFMERKNIILLSLIISMIFIQKMFFKYFFYFLRTLRGNYK